MALLYGGVKYGKQLEQLGNQPDIIVATPGRLLDHISQKNLSLNKIEILILDEVDRMLDMGFVEDVTRIIQKTPRSRQTLFFSATIPDSVSRLSKWALRNPAEAKIDIKISAADTVSHALYPVPAIQKFDLLIALIKKIKFENLIIFFFKPEEVQTKLVDGLPNMEKPSVSSTQTSNKEIVQKHLMNLKMERLKYSVLLMSHLVAWIFQMLLM